ncbi:MAG: hypothetical protein ACXW02_08115 [Halobacteriota archaeon]
MLLPPPHPQIGGSRFDPLSRRLHGPTPRESAVPAELWKAHNDFRDQLRKFVSDDFVEVVHRAIEEARKEWLARSGKLAGNGRHWASARSRARGALESRLKDVLPQYAEFRELQKAYHETLFEKVRLRPPVLEPVVGPADPSASVFQPPFSLDSIGPALDNGRGPPMDIVDRSFARREIGHLVVDADLAFDPDAVWGLGELFGILPIAGSVVAAACGTAFTVPQDGRLVVTASLRNFYSRVTLGLRDKWGSSSGRLGVDVTLFIAVLRPDGGEVLHSLVSEHTLESDGDDLSEQLPDIEQQVFRLLASTEGRFEAGETVSVLAGVFVSAASVLNDMEAYIRPLLWWGLEELSVAVTQ